MNAQKKDETKIADIEEVILKKPLLIDGKEINSLTLDFGGLTGNDMEGAEAEVIASGINITGPHEVNKTYLLAIAARASKININDLRSLSIKDAATITLMVQGFLLN
ncbi:phage tail assembly protein [Serratia sp. MF2]|uniref:phage tail assembly protein n=1 Tax=Serratia sp. MF1(2023) TaxID=3059171 RepID=UPI0027EDD018|nr:phage tail assembly protein [Serratia sp. MF1(2023)]MDQ7104210.1 phage tail assembly protein [Serratia sp. MF1(2023)]